MALGAILERAAGVTGGVSTSSVSLRRNLVGPLWFGPKLPSGVVDGQASKLSTSCQARDTGGAALDVGQAELHQRGLARS